MENGSNARARRLSIAAKAVAALVGLATAVGQIALMREVIEMFNGNELSLGVFLAVWLALTAGGSSLAGRLVPRAVEPRTAIAAGECLSSLSLPFGVWLLRFAKAHLQTVPGESLGLLPLVWTCLASLSAFCLVSGFLFALAARMYREDDATSTSLAISKAYLLETAGFACGGVLTSFLLLASLNSFQIILTVCLLNLWVACGLYFSGWGKRIASAIVATALVAGMVVRIAPLIERVTQERIWTGFRLIGSAESIYGKLTVLEAGNLRSIYENGSVLANVPDPAAAEETVDYALLEHPAPRRVLLIGGGINGSIIEVLKHPTIERLDYLELDPALIRLYQRLFPVESARAFSDSRVHVHYADGRLYLKSSESQFDAVILSVPDPENAQLNRFYTAEFFQSVREHLSSGGLIALQLRASEDSIGPELADFLRCIHQTLRSVFPDVVVIPGEMVHMLGATQKGVLSDDPQILTVRLRERALQTQYVREYFIPFRMMPDRMAQIEELLRPLPATPVNRDFSPVAYYFGAALWSAQFRSGSARLLEDAIGIPFVMVFGAIAALSLLSALVWLLGAKRRAEFAAAWSVVATGYTLMTLQVLLLLAFQSVYGYVYYNLALLIGMFMAGLALGSLLGIARVRRSGEQRLMRAALVNQVLLSVAAPLLLALVALLARSSVATGSMAFTQLSFSALAVVCGIPGGFQFPVACAIYQRKSSRQQNTGTLFALDLAGGCVGALLLAGFLIPLFGFWNTAWTAAGICVMPAIVLAWSRFSPGEVF